MARAALLPVHSASALLVAASAALGCAAPSAGAPGAPSAPRPVRAPSAAAAEADQCAVLPSEASSQLQASLRASRAHARHAWRDVPPFNDDGTLNAYVEIPLGESHKWELDIAAHQLRLDRIIDASLGGYPINYGFVPQTISCDGDPFDALVLGPPLQPGVLVRGAIVGLLLMHDEKGPDAKVILAPSGEGSALTPELRDALRRWFDAYKGGSTDGRWSSTQGFGSAEDGRHLVERTHRFFREGSDE